MNHRSGFTLVELLVAVLTATVAAALFGVCLHAGLSAWARLSAGSGTLEAVRFLSRLERDVASSFPLPGAEWTGTRDGCSIPRWVIPPGSALAAPVQVVWSFDPRTRTATREEEPLEEVPGTLSPAEQFGPFSGSVRIEYAAAPVLSGASPDWRDDWTGSGDASLPFLVRVRVGPAERWLPLRLHTEREPLQ